MNNTSASAAPRVAVPVRQLTLFDTTSIIVGIIIGSSIYQSSPLIASCFPTLAGLIGAWVAGGVLSLIGALCYTELGSAYPQEGGDYVYLTRAFGRRLGFLFAWAQLWIVRPGSIGTYAYVFAAYAFDLFPIAPQASRPLVLLGYAAVSVIVLTAINLLGIRQGKWTQNLLTTIKVVALLAVVAVGFYVTPAAAAEAAQPTGRLDLRLAMILIFYAYSGWNEMAYVAAEVRNPERNIFRALLLGTVAVTAIYLALNLAFARALGFAGFQHADSVASQVMQLGMGDWGKKAIALLICISALGAINGMIFTGARIYYAMGTQHRLFAALGQWNERKGPAFSLLIQSAITLALLVGFALFTHSDGFTSLVTFTAPVFWIFFLLVGVSVTVLRWREPQAPRPFRVPGYPLPVLVFCASNLFMLYASVTWAYENRSYEAFWSIAIMAVGLALCFLPGVQDRGEGRP